MRKMNLLAACLAVALAACTATPPATPNLQARPTALPTVTPTSAPIQMAQRTADARQAQALVMAWQAKGQAAEAAYDPSPERIEWRLVRSALPANTKLADQMAYDAAAFAARASAPARIEIVVKNHREDERLSRAIKAGALASGGKNKVKLDHVIAPARARQILIETLDSR